MEEISLKKTGANIWSTLCTGTLANWPPRNECFSDTAWSTGKAHFTDDFLHWLLDVQGVF